MKIVLILFLTTYLFANIKQHMFNLYKDKKYVQTCNIGFKGFNKFKNDEKFVSLYAFACLKSDFIDRLSIPITRLKLSKESRANASFFSIILMQKKLLYYALIDNYDIASLNLPSTDYVLSKVFDLYVKLGVDDKRKVYLFEDEKDNRITYKLFLVKTDKVYKMVIEEFYDKITVKRHIYW
ncbi:MAG: hypothetical protein U9P72_10900 [Campylobacterota bacterium]|nr:hypothetical protein [Campylobacterota bacterium]